MQLGIDYGTTTTLVSYRGDSSSSAQLVDIGNGPDCLGYEKFTIPSIIAVTRKGDYRIGYEAERISDERPDEVIILCSLKKCLACERRAIEGRTGCWNSFNQRFCLGSQGFKLFGSVITAPELVNKFIYQLLQIPAVNSVYKSPHLDGIGISVPAMFGSDPRRTVYNILLEFTEGKKRIDVINEPTAAILACKGQASADEDGIYVICDVGGGTTDIVVYEKDGDSYFLFRPNSLPVAGDDVDNLLLEHLVNHDLNHPEEGDAALAEVRRAKELLTLSREVLVFKRKLSRERFEEIIHPVLERIVDGLEKEIRKVFDAYKPYSQTGRSFNFNKVYLSGGGAKVPLLKSLIQRKLNAFSPEVEFITNPVLSSVYADDVPIVVVALGAAMPKKGVSDSIQYMLPYAIYVKIGDDRKEKAPIYSELPLEFSALRPRGVPLELLAVDPNNPQSPVHNLTDELVSTAETGETLLSDFLDHYTRFRFTVDKYNRLIVTAVGRGYPHRPFPLPWQGGIEGPLFEKYRKEWRRQHGYT